MSDFVNWLIATFIVCGAFNGMFTYLLTYLCIYLFMYLFMILSGSVRNTRTHYVLPTFSWWVGPLSSICRLKWGDTRTQNHTEGRHGAAFRCTKAVPWVQPGSVESGSDFWCRCALQGREQPGGAGVKAADWCFLIPSLAEKHTGFLLRAAGEFITSPLSSVYSEDCRKWSCDVCLCLQELHRRDATVCEAARQK